MLVLPATLRHADAAACLQMLVQAMRAEARATPPTAAVVVDAIALRQFDSSALAVLLACRREAQAQTRAFAMRGLHARLAALAGVYGVSALLPAEAAPGAAS